MHSPRELVVRVEAEIMGRLAADAALRPTAVS